MKRLFIFLLACTVFISFKEKKQTNKTTKRFLDELYTVMQGSYNSEAQSKKDSTYYNISLHMYPIWDGNGHYLYVEQALHSTPKEPYRQRIYKLNQLSDSTFTSEIYTLSDDALWIGKWKNPEAFNSISEKDITLKSGCEVVLKRISKNYYKGKTGDKTCVSKMRGASFARSEVEILENKIMSWDRGFDNKGGYVWGAEKGGYIFNKLE